MTGAARGNGNALLLSGAPGLTGRARATSARVEAGRTNCGDVDASVGLRAEQESSLQSQASSAVIVSLTASRNGNALLLDSAPGSVGNTALAATALIEIVGASLGNNSAGVSGRAPSESGLKSSALAAVIVSSAAAGNLNAFLLSGAPSSASSFADTVAAVIVIVGAIGRNGVAS